MLQRHVPTAYDVIDPMHVHAAISLELLTGVWSSLVPVTEVIIKKCLENFASFQFNLACGMKSNKTSIGLVRYLGLVIVMFF